MAADFSCTWNPITRLPSWLRQAFSLQKEEVPRLLASQGMYVVVDAAQGGWAFATTNGDSADQPDNSPAPQSVVIKDFDENVNRILLHASAQHLGGAGAVEIPLFMSVRPQAPLITVQVELLTVPIGTATASFVFNINRPTWIPPAMAATFLLPATAVGEAIQVSWIYADIPVGFTPTQ